MLSAGNQRAGIEPESTMELRQPAGLPGAVCSLIGFAEHAVTRIGELDQQNQAK
jgi:hypothetical protein